MVNFTTDEMARRRIESLERYLQLYYCAAHSYHFKTEEIFTYCPSPARVPGDKCYINYAGVPL